MRKFGVIDIILAVLVVVGIAANVFVYGFYNRNGTGGKPDDIGKQVEATEPPSGSANSSSQGEKSPEQDKAEQPVEKPADKPEDTPGPEPGSELESEHEPEPQSTVVNTLVFKLNSPNLTVNGREAAIDGLGSAPYNQGGASVLPLRATYEILGGSIDYDADTKYMTAKFLDTSLKVKTGETGAEINGKFATLPVAPVTKDGTAYVPARAIADALGAELLWDAGTQSIILEIPSQSVIDTTSLLSAASPAPVDYTPAGAPTAGDFTWFMDGVRTAGMPQDAVRITDLNEIFGDWKMFIWIDPDHKKYNDSSYILATVKIDEVGGSVSMMIQKLKMVDEDGTTQDISRFEAEQRIGGYLPDDRGISVGESWDRYTITDFYTKNGKQYGIGINEVQSGEPCYVALVRP